MQFLKIILATTILFFAIKPGIDLISLNSNAMHSCCEGKCSPVAQNHDLPDQSNESGDCSKELCNPFQACGCCILLCSFYHTSDLANPEIAAQVKYSYPPFFISEFSLDFWHPPKIV